MEWFVRMLLTVALVSMLIYFAQWVTDGDFQKTVIILFSFVMIDLLNIRNKLEDL